MAALALMTAACSNDDNDLTTQQPQKAEGITITAQLAPKTIGTTTRAVSEGTNKIVSEWAENEHVAVLYEVSSTKYMADATITAVDGSGTATITFNVEDGTPDDTPCTLVYPLSAAKDDHTGVKDAATLLAAQDGTLNANLDVRVGEGTIYTTTPGLTVTTQPAAQFAIWKLTLANDAKNLCIMADNITIAGATLGTEGTEFYVAVPAVSSQTVTIVANDASNNCYYFSKAGVSLVAGRYYQSSPTMTTLGTESSADVYKITGTSGVAIPAGKTVVLSGVTISNGQIACSGNANMILMGANTVTAANEKAAIKIGGSSTTLTITGSGSLTAQGGSGGAGIGTDYYNEADGTLSCGNIVINGGTVTATGGYYGAGIGTGRVYTNTGSTSITCGDITINGGTVTATGGPSGAGIGTGDSRKVSGGSSSNRCGNITIGTGVISVTATKGSGSPNSIGKGYAGSGCTQTCGTITIGGDATTYATGVTTSPFTYPTVP